MNNLSQKAQSVIERLRLKGQKKKKFQDCESFMDAELCGTLAEREIAKEEKFVSRQAGDVTMNQATNSGALVARGEQLATPALRAIVEASVGIRRAETGAGDLGQTGYATPSQQYSGKLPDTPLPEGWKHVSSDTIQKVGHTRRKAQIKLAPNSAVNGFYVGATGQLRLIDDTGRLYRSVQTSTEMLDLPTATSIGERWLSDQDDPEFVEISMTTRKHKNRGQTPTQKPKPEPVADDSKWQRDSNWGLLRREGERIAKFIVHTPDGHAGYGALILEKNNLRYALVRRQIGYISQQAAIAIGNEFLEAKHTGLEFILIDDDSFLERTMIARGLTLGRNETMNYPKPESLRSIVRKSVGIVPPTQPAYQAPYSPPDLAMPTLAARGVSHGADEVAISKEGMEQVIAYVVAPLAAEVAALQASNLVSRNTPIPATQCSQNLPAFRQRSRSELVHASWVQKTNEEDSYSYAYGGPASQLRDGPAFTARAAARSSLGIGPTPQREMRRYTPRELVRRNIERAVRMETAYIPQGQREPAPAPRGFISRHTKWHTFATRSARDNFDLQMSGDPIPGAKEQSVAMTEKTRKV